MRCYETLSTCSCILCPIMDYRIQDTRDYLSTRYKNRHRRLLRGTRSCNRKTHTRTHIYTAIIQCQWVNGNWRNLSRGSDTHTHTRPRDLAPRAAAAVVVSTKNIAPRDTCCTKSSIIIESSQISFILTSL